MHVALGFSPASSLLSHPGGFECRRWALAQHLLCLPPGHRSARAYSRPPRTPGNESALQLFVFVVLAKGNETYGLNGCRGLTGHLPYLNGKQKRRNCLVTILPKTSYHTYITCQGNFVAAATLGAMPMENKGLSNKNAPGEWFQGHFKWTLNGD